MQHRLFDDCTDALESCRRSLLQYYSSQNVTHAGYLIALIIGGLTLVSRWDTFKGNWLTWDIFISLLSIVAGVGFYFLGRTISWATFEYEILNSPIVTKTYAESQGFKNPTVTIRLHLGTRDVVFKKKGWLKYFHRIKGVALAIVITLAIFSVLLIHSWFLFKPS